MLDLLSPFTRAGRVIAELARQDYYRDAERQVRETIGFLQGIKGPQSLAGRLRDQVLRNTPPPKDMEQVRILVSRLPRNRKEARRLIATEGKVARV